ncbi:MAG: DUF5996 family protein [bacterium]
MAQIKFPAMPLADWQPTRDTIHRYCQLVGAIRSALTPPQKHWWHVSLLPDVTGLTTTAMPAGENCAANAFKLQLDFTAHKLVLTTSLGQRWHLPLQGQSVATFCDQTLAALTNLGIQAQIDRDAFSDESPREYDQVAAERFWLVLSQIDAIFRQFKSELRQETSAVNLWPHHFDMAFVWFSGRLVPGVDPADAENADEQMSFGFSTGDETIPDAYFYISAYPMPDGLEELDLPAPASWNTRGFEGVLLMYESLVGIKDPRERLLELLRTVFHAGSNLMK